MQPPFSYHRKLNPRTPTCTMLATSLISLSLHLCPATRADEVTDWNQQLLDATHVAGTSPLLSTRIGALVQSAVFDALNGIERKYQSIHVAPNAPRGASRRAAVVQAAYTMLVHIYPAQKPAFDAQLTASLEDLLEGGASSNDQSVTRGLAWGQAVADATWTWRSADGITPASPPFLGGLAPGEWRPTPPAFLPGAAPQFAHMLPWALQSPSQFRPPGPPALTSDHYTADFNEIKTMGSISSLLRTADQTLFAQFWQSDTVTYFWNRVAVSLASQHNFTLSDNAYLLGMLNIALADAAIACWDGKYQYVFWRPITAVRLADTDGNPDTQADPNWTPLLITPNFPEYASGHSTTSGAAATVLAHFFGENTPFSVDSTGLPGVVRSFASFSDALQEIKDARVFGGIHFRTACNDATVCGQQVAHYIFANAMQPAHGESDRE
jgi:hypothetical protein